MVSREVIDSFWCRYECMMLCKWVFEDVFDDVYVHWCLV